MKVEMEFGVPDTVMPGYEYLSPWRLYAETVVPMYVNKKGCGEIYKDKKTDLWHCAYMVGWEMRRSKQSWTTLDDAKTVAPKIYAQLLEDTRNYLEPVVVYGE